MGFAHQTYAEFLASRYILAHNMGTQKELSLLRHPDDPDGSIVPQLYEIAGWVASGNEETFTAIVGSEPQVLLRGDMGSLSGEDRQRIVDALLRAMHERRINDRNWGLLRQYGKLKHRGLADQLRPWLTDREKHYTARDTAMEIAEGCELSELQDTLTTIALDPLEAIRLRNSAARSLAKTADADTRRRLLPLALGEAGDDPQDQLKGHALRAIWPDLICAEELFQNLSLPKQENFHGAYLGFLRSDLIERMKPDDLPYALG